MFHSMPYAGAWDPATTRQAVERISSEVEIGPEIEELLAFIAASERGFVK